ncbi:MAG: sugar ABC transporter permease [Bacilli bacterium]|nr:sugar ABC transporter permease [Bacilli bacterium]
MESKNNWKAWLYLAPVLILLAVFTFYPIINTVYVSFLKDYNYTTGTHSGFAWFDNYVAVLTPYSELGGAMYEKVMKIALPNTLLITIITVPLSIIISMVIALTLNSIKILKKFFQTVFFMPYVTNAIAIGMVFSVIFSTDYGIFNNLLGVQNLAWIYRTSASDTVNYWRALFAICFYIIWHSLPYKILIFLGGLQNIDAQYYDAAKIDSAPKWKIALKITVPLLSPQILYMMITSFIGSFKEYNSVIGLFGKDGGNFDVNTGPSTMQTMVFFIYDQVDKNNVHYASAASIFLFLIIMAFTVIQNKVSKKRVHY